MVSRKVHERKSDAHQALITPCDTQDMWYHMKIRFCRKMPNAQASYRVLMRNGELVSASSLENRSDLETNVEKYEGKKTIYFKALVQSCGP